MNASRIVLIACGALFLAVHLAIIPILRSDKYKLAGRVRRLYNFNTIYVPAVLSGGFLLDALNGRLVPATWACLILAIAGPAARIYTTHIEPRVLRIRKVIIRTPKLSQSISILHISDFESDAVRKHEPRVFRYIRAINPDLLIHTGDLMNPKPPATYHSDFPKLCALFKTTTPSLGKWNVVGEVDEPVLTQLLAGAGGMKTLHGTTAEIRVPGGGGVLQVLGLTLEQSGNEGDVKHLLQKWHGETSSKDFRLLLGHRPDFALTACEYDIDLCLAGHTHGGQVRLPLLGALITMSTVPRRLARGFHRFGKTWINVSAGVGFEHEGDVPALRFNCPPEMTLITLLPQPEH